MHMLRKWGSGVLLSLSFTALLAACSSGGEGETPSTPPPAATSAEGLWTGTSDDGRTVSGVVLDDDTYWFLYSAVGNPLHVGGALQGKGSAHQSTFTSSIGTDFNREGFGPLDVTVTARYVMRQSFNGTVTYPPSPALPNGAQTTFTSTFNAAYDATPNVDLLVGTYTSLETDQFGFSRTRTITVSPSGSITGTEITETQVLTCSYTGALSPRAKGNVYEISITPAGFRCGGDLLTGIAVFDAATNRLYIVTINSITRVFAFLFLGTKQ